MIDTIQETAAAGMTSPISAAVLHIEEPDEYTEALAALPTLVERQVPVIVVSDWLDVLGITELVHRGAVKCSKLPMQCETLRSLLDALTVRARFLANHGRTRPAVEKKRSIRVATSKCPLLFCGSGRSAELMEQLRRIAPTMTTVLLTGETGVGKSSVARLIHEVSPRSKEPFVTVNCGVLSSQLTESELLGHVRGAFTGAVKDRKGKFEVCRKGTLLLDDVDILPLSVQASLLRVVDEREFEPVGSSETRSFNGRLIVATNRDLEAKVRARTFREDLYYRINVASFHIAPLRERPDLTLPLAETFLEEFAKRDMIPTRRLSAAVVSRLLHYHWPGNIRELRNCIERAHSLCESNTICERHLPRGILQYRQRAANPLKTWQHQPDDVEKTIIQQALMSANNNRAKAARTLGMSRVTLYKKLSKHDLL